MLHKCIKCGKIYDNKSAALLFGCECGTRLFMIYKDEKTEVSNVEYESVREKLQEATKDTKFDEGKPIVFKVERKKQAEHRPLEDEVENVKVFERGLYEINVESLMRGSPIVIKTDKEVYYVQMPKVARKK